jgi:prepilin-type N-terminal cleavage/methylation domain-containing protein
MYAHPPRGFTLVEMLVVITILLIIAAMTVAALNWHAESDRIHGAARQVQSVLEGARGRAMYAKEFRGVRFLLDPLDLDAPPNGPGSRSVASMIYVQPTKPWSGAVIITHDDPADPLTPLTRVRLRDPVDVMPNFTDLRNRGLLRDGARIRMPDNDKGTWYVIVTLDDATYAPEQDLILSLPFAGSSGPVDARIELPPSVMPNQEPVSLPNNIVIDLDRCGLQPFASNLIMRRATKLPAYWKVPSGAAPEGFVYTSQLDIMFSPRGAVTGPAAGSGLIHLYLTEREGSDRDLDPGYVPASTADEQPVEKLVVTIYTRTGHVSSAPVNTDDAINNQTEAAGPDGLADDPFKFAESP